MIPLTLRLSRTESGDLLIRSNRNVPYSEVLAMHFVHHNRQIYDEEDKRWELLVERGNHVEMIVADGHPAEGYVLDKDRRVKVVEYDGKYSLKETKRILKAGEVLTVIRVDRLEKELLEESAA